MKVWMTLLLLVAMPTAFAEHAITMTISNNCGFETRHLQIEVESPHKTVVSVRADHSFTVNVPENTFVRANVIPFYCIEQCTILDSKCLRSCRTTEQAKIQSKWTPAENGGVVPVKCLNNQKTS